MEAETALRKLGAQPEDQRRAEQFYLTLREKYRQAPPATPTQIASNAD